MGHLDPMAAALLNVPIPPRQPRSSLSSPSCDILQFFLPFLGRVRRGRKGGKHPEGGGGEE